MVCDSKIPGKRERKMQDLAYFAPHITFFSVVLTMKITVKSWDYLNWGWLLIRSQVPKGKAKHPKILGRDAELLKSLVSIRWELSWWVWWYLILKCPFLGFFNYQTFCVAYNINYHFIFGIHNHKSADWRQQGKIF